MVSDNGTPGNPGDDIPIGSQTIVGGLVAGASTILTFPWDTTGANLGAHTLVATHDVGDDNGGNDSASTNVTVNAPSLELTVTEVLPGCMLTSSSMNVTIKGTGFAPGATVALVNFSGPTPTVSNPAHVDAETLTATFTTKNGGPPRDRIGNVQVTVNGSTATGVGIFTISPTSCPAAAITSLGVGSLAPPDSAEVASSAPESGNGQEAVIGSTAAVDAALAEVVEGQFVQAPGIETDSTERALDEQTDPDGAAAVTSSVDGRAASPQPAPLLTALFDEALPALVDLALADLDAEDALFTDLVADGM